MEMKVRSVARLKGLRLIFLKSKQVETVMTENFKREWKIRVPFLRFYAQKD